MILPAGIARFWSRDITGMICIAVASAMVLGLCRAGAVVPDPHSLGARDHPGGGRVYVHLACCSAMSAAWSGRCFPAAISRRDRDAAASAWLDLFSARDGGYPARAQDRLQNRLECRRQLFDPRRFRHAMSVASASTSRHWSAPTATRTSMRRRRRTPRRLRTRSS